MAVADAPYDTHDGLLAVIHLRSIGAFAPGALVVIETAKGTVLDANLIAAHHLTVHDSRAYGKTALHFLSVGG